MPTTWTYDLKLVGQANATYNEPTVTYSQVNENYVGQANTTWTNEAKN